MNSNANPNSNASSAAERVANGECPHVAVTPRWDNIQDMGKADRATYVCDACGASLTPAEAEEAQRASAEHVREAS